MAEGAKQKLSGLQSILQLYSGLLYTSRGVGDPNVVFANKVLWAGVWLMLGNKKETEKLNQNNTGVFIGSYYLTHLYQVDSSTWSLNGQVHF